MTANQPKFPSDEFPSVPSRDLGPEVLPCDTLLDSRELWEEFRRSRAEEIRSRLVSRHLRLVYHAAREYMDRLPPDMDYHELASAGTLGLIAAVNGFNPANGYAFSTYALPRIRGAMLDELRSWDLRPRRLRGLAHQLDRATGQLGARLGRAPSEAEVCAHMNVDRQTLAAWRAELERATSVSLEHSLGTGDGQRPVAEVTADPMPGADLELERRELLDQLQAALVTLPERERQVLALYYVEELTLRDIGTVLGVTESRVSQVRTAALRRLRSLPGFGPQ